MITAAFLPLSEETESTRDAQRVRDRDRPRRRPPGHRAGSHGAPDPPGRPGGGVPPARPRRARPSLRAAAGPLPAGPGPDDGLRNGLPRGVRAPGRAGRRRTGLPARRPLPPGGPRLRRRPRARYGLRGHAVPRRARAQRPAGERVRRRRHPGRGRPQADLGVGARGDPQRVPRLRRARLRRARDGGEQGRPGRPCGDIRAARQPAPRAVLRAAGRARALRADGRPDHARPRRQGAPRRRLGARARRAELRLRRRHAAELPGRADPGLHGRHARRPRGPRGGRPRRAQRRHPAHRGRPAHPERAARATSSSPSPPASPPARRWSRSRPAPSSPRPNSSAWKGS